MDGAEIRLRSWRRVGIGKLLGFATVDLPCGLQISDVMVYSGRDGLFAQLPQRPVVRSGALQRGSDGKPLYDAPITWQNRGLRDEFSAAVIALIRAKWPGDLEALQASHDGVAA